MTFDVYSTGMYRAVEKAGSVAKLAELVGVTRQGIYPWLVRGYAPPKRAAQIAKLYDIPLATLLKPKLAERLAETNNPMAQTGMVSYESRGAAAKVEESADDLV